VKDRSGPLVFLGVVAWIAVEMVAIKTNSYALGAANVIVLLLFLFGLGRPMLVWLGKQLDDDGPPPTEEEIQRQNAEYRQMYDENDDPRPWWAEELRRRYHEEEEDSVDVVFTTPRSARWTRAS
jgi:hypothetical protein